MAAADEIQHFIDVNGLSPKVAGLLSSAPAAVQRAVLDQGSLASCRDPNAGCVGRIRKAERSVAPVGFVPPSRDEVEAFIEENELNERAGEALRGAAPAVQWHVLEQGSLLSCREPSAGCIGRISKAQKNLDPALLAIPQGPAAGEVEEFIQDNGLDERASSALRSALPWLQGQVLDQGSLHSCRDRNAGLMGRLRRGQQGQLAGPGQGQSQRGLSANTAQEVEHFILDNGLNERAADALRTAGSTVQRQVLEQGSLSGTREPSAACIGRISKIQKHSLQGWGAPSLDDVESFIYENRLDSRAAAALEAAPPVVQQSLLSQGHLRGNASRACMEQIRAANKVGAPCGADVADVEYFIRENDLNDRAAEALRGIPPEVQIEVMDQGSLATCRDPNAGCIGRIAKAQAASKRQRRPSTSGSSNWPSAEEVDAFVREHDLSERCVAVLNDVPALVLRAVLDQGSLRGCRDPSAGCIGRIKKAQQALKDGTLSVSRGTKRPHRHEEVAPVGGRLSREVDRFVREHELSERATTVLLEQQPQVQEMVLRGGTLRGTRDMSAACMGRIQRAVRELSQRRLGKDSGSPSKAFRTIGGSRGHHYGSSEVKIANVS